LLGPPGAGKGTLAKLLKSDLHIDHISTGDILREEIKNKTKLGTKVKEYIDNGQLVPDEIVTQLVELRLTSPSSGEKGFMLDGFPRTRHQAEDLDRILEEINKPTDYAIYLESTVPVIIRRLTGRRICRSCSAVYHIVNRPPKKSGICDECGGNDLYQRQDDNEKTIRNRMDVYLENTLPIVKYYEAKGKLKRLMADTESEELHEHLMKMFDEEGKLHKH